MTSVSGMKTNCCRQQIVLTSVRCTFLFVLCITIIVISAIKYCYECFFSFQGASEKATKTLLRKKEKKTEEGKNKQKKDGDGKNKQKEDEKNKQKEDEKNKQKKARDVIEAGRQLCQKFLHYPKSGM